MNSPSANQKAQSEIAVGNFSVRSAFIAYPISVITFVVLVIALGVVVSGQLPTARGYMLLLPYALVTSVAIALISGRRTGGSILGAIRVGVIGGVSLLAITSAAAYIFGVIWRAV